MTESIKVCACSLCASVIVCLIIRLLIPQGSTKRIMTVIIGIFILCILLMPITEFIKEFDSTDIENEFKLGESKANKIYDDQVLKGAGEYISAYCYSLLSNAGVEADNIETTVGVSDDRGIYIIGIDIYISDGIVLSDNEIRELIHDSVGVEPGIINA